MKTRFSFLIVMLLVLPLVLAACGGSDTDTAQKYIEAIADGDKDEAERHVCDDNKDELTGAASSDSKFEVDDLKCEEDGDDVKCTYKLEGSDVEMSFAMEDGKVCENTGLVIDGIDMMAEPEIDDTPPADDTTEEGDDTTEEGDDTTDEGDDTTEEGDGENAG